MPEVINNKKVLRNSVMLYIRMGLVMIVTFYTSRVILDILGVADYGIYNIVGSVVVLFNFVNNILNIAIRRFISTEIVSDSEERVATIFKASVRTVVILSCIIAVLLETIGLWFVNYKLNIPAERLPAANWCFQFSIITFIFNLLAVPYNAAIVSYERMSIYAYFGIIDVFLRLAIVVVLQYTANFDSLVLYSFMMCIVANFVRYLNVYYCSNNIIPNVKKVAIDKSVIKSILSYSTWAMSGAVIGIIATQGVNIIMNVFYGVVINAALGISHQVSSAVHQFGSNFQTAFNPQLTKSYAAYGMNDRTFSFCVRMSKLSVSLILIICIPLMLNMDNILRLWLVKAPLYTKELCIIALVYVFFEILSMPLFVLIYAKGDIKTYSISLSLIQIVYVISVYCLCNFGFSPVQVLSLNIVNALLLFLARLYMIKVLMDFNCLKYFKIAICPLFLPTCLLLFVWFKFNYLFSGDGFFILSQEILSIDFFLIISLFFFYLNKEERTSILKLVKIKK